MNPLPHGNDPLLSRRRFFTSSMSGLGSVALASLLRDDGLLAAGVTNPAPHFAPKAKNCIYLFMEGGPSQMDLVDLLELVDGNAVSCGEVRDRCLEHLGVVRARLRELRKLDRALADIIDECRGDDTPECAFMEELFDDGK